MSVRTWGRLGLIPRLAMSCGAVLAAVSFILIFSFVRFESAHHDREGAQRLEGDLAMLTSALTVASVAGDYIAVAELLKTFARRPGVEHVAWVDRRGGGVAVDGTPIVRTAPAWFVESTGLRAHAGIRSIVVGGTHRAEVSLRLNPAAAVNAVWDLVAGGAVLALLGVGVVLLVVLVTVEHGLRSLAGLVSAVGRFGNGDFGVRVVAGATAEIASSIDAFNGMAERVGAVFDSLREGEAKNRRLAMIVEQSGESIVTRDLNGMITFWNKGAERLFGWTAEEAIGRLGRELHLRDLSEDEHARMLERMRSAQSWTGEVSRRNKHGVTLQVAATRAPLLDATGKVIGEIGIGRDVTALKQAQHALVLANEDLEARVEERTAELSRNETLLRAVMDAMPGVVVFHDAQRRYQLFNRQLEAWLRRDAGSIRGRTPEQLLLPENSGGLRPFLDQALAGQATHFEWSYRFADGTIRSLDTTMVPVLAAGGTSAGAASFSMDITERKLSDAALRASEARSRVLATMVEQSTDSIHARDLDGNITYWNHGAERLGGYTAAEAIGQPVGSLHQSGLSAEQVAKILLRIRTGQPSEFEGQRLNKMGQPFEVAIRTAPLFSDDGRLSGEVIVMRDVTAARTAERELRQAKDAAEAASRAKSEFLANMSHEIRTPLNGVLGLTQLVLATELTGSQRDDLELVRTSGASLLTILNDILDFSKIEAGHLQVESIAFAPAERIDGMVKLLASRAHEKGLALTCNTHGLPPLLLGDPGRLTQIVNNLVVNAIKFTEHGEVVVNVGAATDAGHAADTVTLQVSVRDTGIGIEPLKQTTIFDAFTQADASTTRRYGGTGLGLSISAQLARLMGGSIRVHSVPGEGSTFTFTIRCGVARLLTAAPEVGRWADRPAAAYAPARADVCKAARGGHILLTEDNETNQLLARRVLESLGYRVSLAGNGQEALDAIAGESFDLVLMDMQMPVMGGLEATAAIRSREAGGPSRLPIVALTANAMQGDREACLAGGMDDYLAKPFSSDQIGAVLDRWLRAGPGPAATQRLDGFAETGNAALVGEAG